jgi:hypothetical protein
MNDFLVQQENLLHCSSFDRVADTKIEISQAPTTGNFSGKWKRYYLHIDFGIEQYVKGLFTGGVPYRHLKVLDQERTHHFIQHQEQEIPSTQRNES